MQSLTSSAGLRIAVAEKNACNALPFGVFVNVKGEALMTSSITSIAARHFFYNLKLWPSDAFEVLLSNHYKRFLAVGDIVIDVGAHVGRHTLQFADSVGSTGHVYAFEPLPDIFNELSEAVKSLPSVSVENIALSGTVGNVEFVRANGIPGESGLKERLRFDVDNAALEMIKVPSQTLDAYFKDLERVNYIKLDIEGGELTVLRSGLNLLRRTRPILSVEWGVDAYGAYGHSCIELYEFATSLDYTIVDLFGNPVIGSDAWLNTSDKSAWDFFVIPNEKLGWFLHRTFA